LQTLTTCDIDIPVGQETKTLMLHELAGIKDEITVIRKRKDTFFILCTGAVEASWIEKHVPESGKVVIHDQTAGTCGLGVKGAKVSDIMQSIDPAGFAKEAWTSGQAKELYISNVPVLAVYDSKN